jgi:hypothetical protein
MLSYLKQRPANRLQQKQRLRGLLPQRSIVAPEPIKGAIVDIAQAKKAAGQISDREGQYAATRPIVAVRPLLPLRIEDKRWRSCTRTGSFLWLGRRSAEYDATFADDVRLYPEKISLDRDDPSQPPKQRGKPQHELALDRGLRVVIRDTAASNAR